jgi:hypothetical protein
VEILVLTQLYLQEVGRLLIKPLVELVDRVLEVEVLLGLLVVQEIPHLLPQVKVILVVQIVVLGQAMLQVEVEEQVPPLQLWEEQEEKV